MVNAALCGKVHCMQDIMSVYNNQVNNNQVKGGWTTRFATDKEFRIKADQSSLRAIEVMDRYSGFQYTQVFERQAQYLKYHISKHSGKIEEMGKKEYIEFRIRDEKRKKKQEYSAVSLTRSSMPSYEEYCAEIKDIWDSRQLTNMGDKHRRLEEGLRDYLDTQHLTLFTNGHLGLAALLEALKLPPGGEVIPTPFTFASTTHAIVQNGLNPVFCDIDPVSFTMDSSKIEGLITERTCAILPVHVYGNICDVHAIQSIADRYGLKVVYDAAHAFGVTYQGVGAANFGDASMFSFHATKVFHTIEGGAVSSRCFSLNHRLELLKNFGQVGQESVICTGGNAKMSEFQAAMGLCNLRHIDEEIGKRKAVVEQYRSRLDGTPGLQLNCVQKNVRPNYAYFPVLFDPECFGADRDEVQRRLDEHNIGARKYFYPLTSLFDCYAGRSDPTVYTPVALRISGQVLCLPLYADMNPNDVERVCDVILGCQR